MMRTGLAEERRIRAEDERREKEWIARHEVKRANPYPACLHWLTRTRCLQVFRPCEKCYGRYYWMDHTSAWITKDGKRLLCCQPYHISESEAAEIADACREFNLVADVSGTGFYGYGTVCIVLMHRESK